MEVNGISFVVLNALESSFEKLNNSQVSFQIQVKVQQNLQNIGK